jgi:hypothetical protein
MVIDIDDIDCQWKFIVSEIDIVVFNLVKCGDIVE